MRSTGRIYPEYRVSHDNCCRSSDVVLSGTPLLSPKSVVSNLDFLSSHTRIHTFPSSEKITKTDLLWQLFGTKNSFANRKSMNLSVEFDLSNELPPFLPVHAKPLIPDKCKYIICARERVLTQVLMFRLQLLFWSGVTRYW